MTVVAPRTVFAGDDLIAEVTRAALSFRYFLRTHVYIADRSPDGQLRGVLKWEWWPLHDEVCDLLETEPKMAWLKARQEGFSWMLAAWQVHGAMFTPNFLGGIVSAGETEAGEFLNKCAFIHAHLPWASLPTLSTENKMELRFVATDGAIMGFPSTPKAGRSFTFNRWVTDEAAFHEHAKQNYESYSIAAEYGQIVICSSAGEEEDKRAANPWFKDFWLAARDERNGFKACFFDYSRRPGRDDAWYEKESRRLSGSPGAMQREFPRTPEEAFRSMLLLFLDPDAIAGGLEYSAAVRPLTLAPGLSFTSPYLTVWTLPRPGEPYVLACDGAEGKGVDFTTTYVLEARTLRHVAALRENVLEPAEHGKLAAALAKWYNNAWCIVERSHGEAILMQLALAGCRIYRHLDQSVLERWERVGARAGTPRPEGTPGFPMTGQTRPGLLDDFSEAVHTRAFSSPDPAFWREAASFVVVVTAGGTKRAQAATGAHDDTQMAAALAVRMARQPGAQTVKAAVRPQQGPRTYGWVGG